MPHAIVLFDGVCNLCNRSVADIIRHDPGGVFRFACLQSDVARSLGLKFGFDTGTLDTIVLVENGRVYTRSDAALRIARRLEGSSRHWYTARVIPRPVRDAVYDWVSRNRYRWFGRRQECVTPGPGMRERFLDTNEQASAATDVTV
ncbi:MAG: thiol-disulfide oxidoreductase DCC family protein [Dehalococcoidia bacterium]